MITGFNTDVDFEDRVFHVQTEDKGAGNPVVETLIYCQGEIIAQRQTSYADLTETGTCTEDRVLERMENQHQAMIRQILNGRFESEGPKPFGHNIISNRSLDEVVLDFLVENITPTEIRLELLDEPALVEGTRPTLRLRVVEIANEQPVSGARVSVKLASTLGDPIELVSAVTDREGLIAADLALPRLPGVDSAVLCEGRYGAARAELRQIVSKGKAAAARQA